MPISPGWAKTTASYTSHATGFSLFQLPQHRLQITCVVRHRSGVPYEVGSARSQNQPSFVKSSNQQFPPDDIQMALAATSLPSLS